MSASFLDRIKAHVADAAISGLTMEVEHQPLNGPAAPVAPPTYAGEGHAQHAVTDAAFVPQQGEKGWYSELQRDAASGTPRRAPRVVLDSFAAQSGRCETALWQGQERLGISLPALIVDGAPEAVRAMERGDRQLADSLQHNFSTWELAHRQNDAWIKYATAGDGKLVWQQDVVDITDDANADTVKSLVSAASSERGDLLYRYFPNSAIYGYWLSSGVARRHRQARAYSSEVVGYGAHKVFSGATKLDPTGGASASTSVLVSPDGALKVANTGKGKTAPSKLGFGQIPGGPEVKGYVCELILEQSSVSLQVLRSVKYPNAEQALAANTVLTLLALAGHSLAAEDGFLRSGCALVPVEERWGWRRRGSRVPETLEVVGIDEISAALREAISEAERCGLRLAEPITLSFSAPEIELIRQRVANESNKVVSEEK